MKSLQTLVITMGDPQGIGPEIIAKALSSASINNLLSEFNFLIIGSNEILLQNAQKLNSDFSPLKLETPEIPNQKSGGVYLFEPKTKLPSKPAHLSLEYILSAIEIMKSNKAIALVTAPVSKQAIQETGYPFVGHTELLAQKTLARKTTMMFVAPKLKVSLATTHIAYKKLLLYLTTDKILATIEQTEEGLRKYFGISQPRIAVCGLNPHAGEGKTFGREETTIIKPAVEIAKSRKITCQGPFPADSIFYRALKNEFDAVVSLYHDQGLIPLKTLSFFESVQVTLGLPFIRTSPAHGVGFDIATKGIANPSSIIEAIKLAVSMAKKNNASLFNYSSNAVSLL
jgi:4-phospho-D-threonate 3-dehydrogenase / 4-phospho-D-erythronate 3-dehydrogenase